MGSIEGLGERKDLLLHFGNLGSVHELIALSREVLRIGGEELGSVVVTVLVVASVEEEERVAVFVALEVARVLHILAVELGSLLIILLVIVSIGELALAERRIGIYGKKVCEHLHGVVGVDLSEEVGIFHVSGRGVGIVVGSHLIFCSCAAPVFLLFEDIAFEEIDFRAFEVIFASLVDSFGNLLGVNHRVNGVVSACDGDFHAGIFLRKLFSLLEESLCCFGIAVQELDPTLANIVVGVVGVGCDTLLKIFGSGGIILLAQSDEAEVVIAHSLVGLRVGEAARKQVFGVFELVGLVILAAFLMGLRIGR